MFAENYQIEEQVARGGMGVVYRALDLGLERHVALKVMATQLSKDEVYRARFRREASMAARIDHPNVVPVFHRGESAGLLFVVMRLVQGIDLSTRLEQSGGKLALLETSDLVSQVAAGLDAAHQLGLVHRDVKPANIMLEGQRALLTDFGLAKQAEGGEDLTSAGLLLGTAAYLAPEQAQGQRLDARCDVYALACVAYHCLAGRTPYPEGPAVTVAAAHVHSPVPELTGVPTDVAAVVRRGLAKVPGDRWPSAGAFATALAATVGSATARPADDTIIQQVVETAALPVVPTRRTGRLVAIGSLALALGLGGMAAVLLTRGDAPPAAKAPDPHAVLIASLPAEIYSSCATAPAPKEGIVTAVDCRATQTGASSLLVRKWASRAVMDADFAATYAQRYPDGKCSRQTGVRSTWNRGRLACYVNTNGDAVLMYSYADQALQVLAVRADGNSRALYNWWTAQPLS